MMFAYSVYVAASVLLVVAGGTKVVKPGESSAALAAAFPRWPRRPGALAVRFAAAGECTLGAMALVLPSAAVAGGVALCYLLFIGFVIVVRRRGGSHATCGCFGAPDISPTRAHLVIDAFAALAAVCVALTHPVLYSSGESVAEVAVVIVLGVIIAFLAYMVMVHLAGLESLRAGPRAGWTLTGRITSIMERRVSRRSLLVRSAVAGSAVAAWKLGFIVKPESAYASICGSTSCGRPSCSCSDTCCSGFTEFCCVLNGYNSCPEGTIMGGWWMAEGSEYCSGPRYYMDCNAICKCDSGCGDYTDDGFTFCDDTCDGITCECAGDSCGNFLTGCFAFRYGQCNQDVRCTGRIHCRVVTCIPPWEIDPTCTRTAATDDGTANQSAPCIGSTPTYAPLPCPSAATECKTVAIAAAAENKGYSLATSFGKVIGFGDDTSGSIQKKLTHPVVAMATSSRRGYWLLTSTGRVFAIGGARLYGDASALHLDDAFTGMAADPTGTGYWLVNSGGNVKSYGSAAEHGNAVALHLRSPFVSIASTPTGKGYYIVNSAGHVMCYGDAVDHRVALDLHEDKVVSVTTSATGGFWLCRAGGRVLAFGGAAFHGYPAPSRLASPIASMAATASGKGYYLVTTYGDVYCYGDAVNHGNAA